MLQQICWKKGDFKTFLPWHTACILVLTDCYWPARIVYRHFHKHSILKTKGFSDPIYPIRAVSHDTFLLAPSKCNPALLTADIYFDHCHTGLQPGAESIQWDGHTVWQQTGFPFCTIAFKHYQRQNNILSACGFQWETGKPTWEGSGGLCLLMSYGDFHEELESSRH